MANELSTNYECSRERRKKSERRSVTIFLFSNSFYSTLFPLFFFLHFASRFVSLRSCAKPRERSFILLFCTIFATLVQFSQFLYSRDVETRSYTVLCSRVTRMYTHTFSRTHDVYDHYLSYDCKYATDKLRFHKLLMDLLSSCNMYYMFFCKI